MASRAQVDPELVTGLFTWLRRVFSGAERQHLLLDGVDIVHGHIEVELLRPLTRRPSWGREVVRKLERQAQPVGHQHNPFVRLGVELPTEETHVELSQYPGVWAVEDDGSYAGERSSMLSRTYAVLSRTYAAAMSEAPSAT